MHKFKKAWTFRSPEVTVEYEAGWEGPLRPEQLKAAKEADVLEEEPDGDDGKTATVSPPRRARSAEK